jgi:DNA-binding transcriptional ArsR family regulator
MQMVKEYKNYSFFDTTVKQKVLSFLKENSGKEYSIKELNKILDFPPSSLSVTLNDLESQSILKSRKDGKYKYFILEQVTAKTFQNIYEGLENIYSASLKADLKNAKKRNKIEDPN